MRPTRPSAPQPVKGRPSFVLSWDRHIPSLRNRKTEGKIKRLKCYITTNDDLKAMMIKRPAGHPPENGSRITSFRKLKFPAINQPITQNGYDSEISSPTKSSVSKDKLNT